MACNRYRDLLSRYVDNEVTPRQRRDLLAHVERCHECAAYLARLRQADVLLKGVPDTGPSERVKQAVLDSARRPGLSVGAKHPSPLRPAHAGWGERQPWRFYTSDILLRFDITPQRIALVCTASALSILGLAYWFNLMPAFWATSLGFTFPRESDQAALSSNPPTPVSLDVDTVVNPVAVPNLVRLAPPRDTEGVAANEPVRIRFDQPMNRSSVQGAFAIDPPAAGTFSWDADNEMRFTPSGAGLLRGVTYSLSVSDTARSLAGTPLKEPLTWAYSTEARYSVIPGELPGSVIPLTGNLTLLFDVPMNVTEAARAVSLRSGEEDLPMSASWDAGTKKLTISTLNPMPEGDIVLRVDGSARTQSGEPLGQAAEYTYTVTLPDSRLRILGPRVEIAGSGAPLPVNYEALAGPDTPLEGVTFGLYNLPGERLSELGAQGRPWPAPLPAGLVDALAPVEGNYLKAGSNQENPDVSTQELAGLPPGTYLLVVNSRAQVGTLSAWQMVVVADGGLLAAGDGASFWATTADGKAWSGAEISLYNSAGLLVEKGVTSAAGLWLPSTREGVTLAIARDAGGHLAALDLSGAQAQPFAPAVEGMHGTGALATTVRTDLPAYYPGQTVNFRALVAPPRDESSQPTPVNELDVSVALLNPQGSVVSMLTLKPDDLGGVSGLFELAPAASTGRYTLRVSMDKEGRDFPLVVNARRADALSVLAVPARGMQPGDSSVEYTISALDSRGEPAVGAMVSVDLRIKGDSWSSEPVTGTLGVSGRATLTVPLPAWAAYYTEPALYLNAEVVSGAGEGSTEVPLDMTSPRRALAGIGGLVSPSLDLAAVTQPQADGTTRLRLVTLSTQSLAGDLLVQAISPDGGRQAWAVDLQASVGDVTLPVPEQFAGGRVYLNRTGVAGSRQIALPQPVGELTLTVSSPGSAAPNEPIPITLKLTDSEGQGVQGVSSIWFRRVSGEIGNATSGQLDWQPALALDANGTGSATLSAPGEPGLWYVMSEAAAAGSAHSLAWSVVEVQAGATIQLPPALVLRVDEVQPFSIVVYNPTGTLLSSGIRTESSLLTRFLGNSSQGIEVPANGWQRLNWRVAGEEPGASSVAFAFMPSAGVEGRWALDLQLSGEERAHTTYTSGVLEGQKTVGVQVPWGLSDGDLALEIRASTSIISALAGVVEDLSQAGAADGKTALWAARLSAAPSVRSAYTRVGADSPPLLEISAIERSMALQQIYAAQRNDGGWGVEVDPSGGPSSLSETAGVLLAIRRQSLAWAEAGGEPQPAIDNDVVNRGLSYLTWEALRPLPANATESQLDDRARALYALALYGAVDGTYIRPYMVYAAAAPVGKGSRLSYSGQAWLALALWQAGNTGDALALVDRLLQTPEATGASAPLLELLVAAAGTNTQGSNGTTGTSSYRLAAPTHARALMGTRQGGVWATPALSADTLWALSRYAAQEGQPSTGTLALTLNDQVVQATAQTGNPGTVSLALSGSALRAGTNWLKLQAPQGGTLYYSLTLKAKR